MAPQTAEQKNHNRQLSTEEEKIVMRNGAILGTTSFVFAIIMALLVHFEGIRLYPTNVNADVIRGFASRVEFVLRYQTLLVVWLLFNVLATIYGRISTMSINPLNEKSEQNVQAYKNILTNSYEQISLSIFAQLVFVSFAQPECILKVIPLVNILQFIGRITFFIGYPFKRSFGFLLTITPTALLIFYNLYKFISFLGLY